MDPYIETKGPKSKTIVNLVEVEKLLNYSFRDRNLGTIALSTWRPGFSRLEFLGDSILGLAVFSTAEVNHFPRDRASARVANRHLDRVFNNLLSRHTSSNSGDVVEALVGAIYLDAGYTEAAKVATTLCLPEHDLSVPPIEPVEVGIGNVQSLSFVGAAVISAAISDDLCTKYPDQGHGWLTEKRSNLISRRRLAEASGRLGYAPEGDLTNQRYRARASDKLESAVGEQFLRRGWEVAKKSSLRISRL